MPLFLLIRHGENEFVQNGRLAGRRPGVHLNEKGQAQARAIAERLKSAPVKAIYSSPLERALETAAPLAAARNLEVLPREGLLETHYGEWQGKTLKSLHRRRLWRLVQGSPSRVRFPGGESFAECQLRVIQELQTIASLHKPKDLLACFFHADPIKLAIAFYLGMPLDYFQRLIIAPASITSLALSETGARLLNLNFDSTLGAFKS